jgi:N6-L-threonylcarbamoyladenine synthase
MTPPAKRSIKSRVCWACRIPADRPSSKRRKNGSPKAFKFPRAFLHERERLAFSFSGLKTAVRYAICPPSESRDATDGAERLAAAQAKLTENQIADLAASFQAAVIECLVEKSLAAIDQTGLRTLAVGGGVAANGKFRAELQAACDRQRIRLHIAPPALCTDNAVMGAIAIERLKAGLIEPLTLDVKPGLVR